MSIIRARTYAGLTRTFVVLVLLLFAAQLLASQPMVMGAELKGSDSAPALADAAPTDGAKMSSDGCHNAQGMHLCETSIAGGPCSVNCSLPYAGKSAEAAVVPVALSYSFSPLSHIGRLISGPEPFPPKPSIIS